MTVWPETTVAFSNSGKKNLHKNYNSDDGRDGDDEEKQKEQLPFQECQLIARHQADSFTRRF